MTIKVELNKVALLALVRCLMKTQNSAVIVHVERSDFSIQEGSKATFKTQYQVHHNSILYFFNIRQKVSSKTDIAKELKEDCRNSLTEVDINNALVVWKERMEKAKETYENDVDSFYKNLKKYSQSAASGNSSVLLILPINHMEKN